jgi:hypothetical protein
MNRCLKFKQDMEAIMAPYNKVFKNMQNEVKQSKIACFLTKSLALFMIWSLWQLSIRNTVSILGTSLPNYICSHTSYHHENVTFLGGLFCFWSWMPYSILSIYLSGLVTAVAVCRNPNTIPFCLTTDLLLNVLFSWLLVHLSSMFFLDILFSHSILMIA